MADWHTPRRSGGPRRYNLFFILYPLGIASETRLVYRAIPYAAARHPWLGYLLWAVLAIYVPGK